MAVVWHAQSNPLDGMTTGAWVLGGGWPTGLDRLPDLLRGTVVVPAGLPANSPQLQHLLADCAPAGSTTIDRIADALVAERERLKNEAAKAVAENKNLKKPVFAEIERPDPEALAEAYHGEPVARRAWAYAQATVQLIEAWYGLEQTRRSRKYLRREEDATSARPMPTGATSSEGAKG